MVVPLVGVHGRKNSLRSTIKGEMVYLALNKKTGFGFAKLMYHDAGFQIIFEGITENEIVSVVSSLIA